MSSLPIVAEAARATTTPLAARVLRAAIADPDPTVRLLAQIGLARARATDGLDDRLATEPDLGVFGVLVARAGRIATLGERSRIALAAQAVVASAPAELRAGCAWALAEHDVVRGGMIAGALATDPEAAFWLASLVARRGGRLAAALAGAHARPELDRIATLIGW